MFKTPSRYPITQLYHQSGILKLNDLFNFKVVKLMHHIIQESFQKL